MKLTPIDPEKARTTIEELKLLDLKSSSFDELDDLLTSLLKGYHFSAPWFIPGLKLYRARIWNRPENIGELLYPPKNKVQQMGRINNIEESVFYCSTANNAVLFETGPNPKDNVIVTEWETTDKLTVSPVGFTQKALQNLKSDKDISKWDITNYPLDVGPGNRLVHEYLGDCFTERVLPGEEYKYKLTITVARKLLASDYINGIAYPAVSMRGNGINLGIKTDYFDRAIKFVSAQFLEVVKVEESEFSCKKLYSADRIDNGQLVWQKEPFEWDVKPGSKIQITLENGKWIARNDDGKIIEPK